MVAEIEVIERERRQMDERYTELATLAGGLAHEIRNPLSTINLNLELMMEDLATGDAPRDRRMVKKLATVRRECLHLERILNAFLQFARAAELELVECDLNRVVQDFITFYQPQAAERDIEISPHLANDLPPVRIDPALIRQVLMNLTLNAQQAMPNGGTLELQTRAHDSQVYLDVIDNGIGMDARTRERIFQTFFSTKPDGSGLGLPTVRRIIDAHHGTICCESHPGSGTRFTIALPAAESSG